MKNQYRVAEVTTEQFGAKTIRLQRTDEYAGELLLSGGAIIALDEDLGFREGQLLEVTIRARCDEEDGN